MVVTHRARPARSLSPGRRLRVPYALTILVVDDDPGLQELIGLKLTHAGYEVKVAGDDQAALAEAALHLPDLAVIDVDLPGTSGFELCRQLRQDPRTAVVPVILLGTVPGDEHARKGAAAGADRYLVKPFGLRSLLDDVAELLPWPDEAA